MRSFQELKTNQQLSVAVQRGTRVVFDKMRCDRWRCLPGEIIKNDTRKERTISPPFFRLDLVLEVRGCDDDGIARGLSSILVTNDSLCVDSIHGLHLCHCSSS